MSNYMNYKARLTASPEYLKFIKLIENNEFNKIPQFVYDNKINVQSHDNCAIKTAFKHECIQVINYLVTKGVNINDVTIPVNEAAINNKLELVKCYYSIGAKINDETFRALCKHKFTEIIDFVIKNDIPNLESDINRLEIACDAQNYNLVKFFSNRCRPRTKWYSQVTANIACRNDDIELLKYAINTGLVSTDLSYSCEQDIVKNAQSNFDILKFLIEWRNDVALADSSLSYAVYGAIFANKMNIIKYCASICPKTVYDSGIQAIVTSSYDGFIEMFKYYALMGNSVANVKRSFFKKLYYNGEFEFLMKIFEREELKNLLNSNYLTDINTSVTKIRVNIIVNSVYKNKNYYDIMIK